MMQLPPEPRTVVVTGASSGIGKATAEHFADRGWNVVATMRAPDGDAGVELGLRARVVTARLDVTDPPSIASAITTAIDRFQAIDVLVNNAGRAVYGPLEACPTDAIRQQFETNVLGMLAVTQAVLPHMRERHRGTIVNVSSIGGRTVFPLGALYHGSKFAIEGISEALTFELDAIGVRMKIVEPGSIKTDFVRRSLEFHNDPSIHEYQALVERVVRHSPSWKDSPGPELVAAAIWQAVNDGTDRLRYLVGDDAIEAAERRAVDDDAAYLRSVRARFHLDEPPADKA